MKVVATIEARMGSSRLPGKPLLPILGRPTLEFLIERLKRVNRLDEIVVATTNNSRDDVLETLAHGLRVGCFRGSEEDVLGRVLGAAQTYQADVIVEITGDCTLIDPSVVQHCINEYFSSGVDYVASKNYVGGMNTQVFSTSVLNEVEQVTRDDPNSREHVSLPIYENTEKYNLHYVEAPEHYARPNIQIELDTQEDFLVIQSIIEALYPEKPDFNLDDILSFLDTNPEILSLNEKIARRTAREDIS